MEPGGVHTHLRCDRDIAAIDQSGQKFIGLALTNPVDKDHDRYFEYFLDPKNHAPGIPLDMISYHYYVGVQPEDNQNDLQNIFFKRADVLIDAVKEGRGGPQKTFAND